MLPRGQGSEGDASAGAQSHRQECTWAVSSFDTILNASSIFGRCPHRGGIMESVVAQLQGTCSSFKAGLSGISGRQSDDSLRWYELFVKMNIRCDLNKPNMIKEGARPL